MKTATTGSRLCLAAALGLLALGAAQAANTDGTMTFSVATTLFTTNGVGTAGQYGSNNCTVVWVVDSSNRFVKTLCRHAQNRIGYLYQWIASRGSYTNVDGVTSATLTVPSTHTVTWNCRDTNNLVVPDGTYYVRAEYTSGNTQGPCTTNWCGFVKDSTVVITNYPDFSSTYGQLVNMALTNTPILPDIGVLAIAPSLGPINASVAMTVTVTNRTASATPAFTVALSNVTADAMLIGTQQVASLAGNSRTNLAFPWDTVGLTAGTYRVTAQATPLATETNLANNLLTNAVSLVAANHDIAVTRITITAVVPPRVVTNVTVALVNTGNLPDTVSVSLTDLTAAESIGARTVTNLAPSVSTNIVFRWNTTNAAIGYHTLQAVADPVAGEVQMTNNTNSVAVIVANGVTTNRFILRGATWRYLDAGLDISGAPWTAPAVGYDDGFWLSGAAPLGYGAPAIATTVRYGPFATNKFITTYFRREFTMDFAPFFVTGAVRKADGVVLYLNGQEIVRQNMPEGSPVPASALAGTELSAVAATSYTGFVVAPSNLVVGRNVLAAEVHLSAATNADMGYDLELSAFNSTITRTNSVRVTALVPDGDVQSGDRLGVTVSLTNAGNAATACAILIRDAVTGALLSSNAGPVLVAGESADVRISWSTLGKPTGTRTLLAFTVIGSVTNLLAVGSNTVSVAALDLAARAVNAAGSVGGSCDAVAATGTTVYLGCGSTLEIWDAAVPSAPVRRGSLRLPGRIRSLVAAPPHVYAAAGVAGVQIVNVSTASAPVHLASFDTSGFAHQVALAGPSLFVADGLGGVRILDVTAPASPVLLGCYQTAGAVCALAFINHHLYVLDAHDGVQVINTNASPSVVGSNRTITAGISLGAVPSAVVAGDGKGGLYRFSTTNQALPFVTTNVLLSTAANALVASTSALYAAAGSAGLLTLDRVTLAGRATNACNGEAMGAALSGSALYVATAFGGCQIWDVSSAFAPVLAGVLRTGGRPVDAAMSGPTLFVAADEGGLQVHSLTNPSAATWVATPAISTNPRCVQVSGPLAYVAEAGGIRMYNMSDPASPLLLGSDAAAGLVGVRRMTLSGSKLAMTDGHQINVVDVSSPAATVLLATNAPAGFVFDLAADTGHVYAACGGGGLRILDSATLASVGSWSAAPDPVVSVSVRGGHAYVGDGRATVTILAITNPTAPSVIQTHAGAGFGVASAGTLAYLVDGRRNGTVVDVTAPLSPVTLQALPNLTQALRVGAQGGLVLVAEDEAGLAIFNASPGDVNLNGIADSVDQQIVDASPSDAIRSVWDVLPGDDFDGDGLSNLAEYRAGTSATDPGSVFAVSAVNPLPDAGGGLFVIRWYSEAGKTYTLHKATDLQSGFAPIQTGIPAAYPINSYTDTVSTARAFYLITVP